MAKAKKKPDKLIAEKHSLLAISTTPTSWCLLDGELRFDQLASNMRMLGESLRLANIDPVGMIELLEPSPPPAMKELLTIALDPNSTELDAVKALKTADAYGTARELLLDTIDKIMTLAPELGPLGRRAGEADIGRTASKPVALPATVESGEPPDPPSPIQNDITEPSTPEAQRPTSPRKKKSTVEDRLQAFLKANPEARDWSGRKLAEAIECSQAPIFTSNIWKALQEEREVERKRRIQQGDSTALQRGPRRRNR